MVLDRKISRYKQEITETATKIMSDQRFNRASLPDYHSVLSMLRIVSFNNGGSHVETTLKAITKEITKQRLSLKSNY